MADAGIKKAVIQNESLPLINTTLEGYLLRYRVVSEDKNRSSHWSEQVLVKPEFTISAGSINHTKSGSVSVIAWDAVSILKGTTLIRKAHEYDIWLRWDRNDNGDWIYAERIDGTSISILTPTTYKINGVTQAQIPNRLSTEIFLKGTPISRNATFIRAYQGGSWTV